MSSRGQLLISIGMVAGAVILGAGAAAGVYFGLLSPKKKEHDALKTEVEQMQAKHDQLIGTERAFQDAQAQMQLRFRRVPQLGPRGFDFLVRRVGELVRDSVEVLNELTPQQVTTAPGRGPGAAGRALPQTLKEAFYSIKVAGGWYDLVRLLYLLETDEMFIEVKRFTISPDNTSGEGRKTMNLTFRGLGYEAPPAPSR